MTIFPFQPAPSMADWSIDPVGDTTYPLPAPLNGDYSWIDCGSIWTEGHVQYVVWVDHNRKARIARRVWRRGWEPAVDLSAVAGSPLSAPFELDSHNTIKVAVDALGYVHVTGNHHVHPLRWMRTANPHDINGAWVTGSMVGTEEDSVTYPQFIRGKSGNLSFMYRHGTSGDADWYLNRWNHDTQTWARVGQIFEGDLENKSHYPHDIGVNMTTGRWHMVWTVRVGSTDPAANRNIYAGYSDDEGVTWRRYSDNALYIMPITDAGGEIVVAHAGGATETLLNSHHGQVVIDGSGNPHSVWLIADAGGIYRYRHVWWDGATWHYDTVLPTTNGSSRRPEIVRFNNGRLWMLFQTASGGRGNKLRCIDLDTNVETVLVDRNMLTYEPVVHYVPSRDVLYILAPVERTLGPLAGDPGDLAIQYNAPVLAIRNAA